jgi:hypothetical protein
MSKVFISHATVDKALADAVQTLIETGVGLPHHEVFCTSLEGLGIPEGTADFKDFIRKQMLDCDTVVALISENYYGSAFCMCELGQRCREGVVRVAFGAGPGSEGFLCL